MAAALKGVKGVADAQVSYQKKEAVVECSDGSVDPKALVAAVAQAGYSATVVSGARP